MPDDPSAALPGGPRPSPGDLRDAETVLRSMQRILANMGRDQRRDSPEFKEIMAYYKHLGTNLHEIRKQVVAEAPPPAPSLARAVPARSPTLLGSIPRPPQRSLAPPSISALGRTVQAYGRTVASRTVAPAAGPAVLPVASPAAASPAKPPAAAAHAAPGPSAGEAALAGVQLQAVSAPEGLPLHLPKFVSTLGPAGSRAINKGPEVGCLQKLLVHQGFEVEVNEVYDVRTYRAVSDFQKLHRVAVNGLVGVEMRKLLNEMVTG